MGAFATPTEWFDQKNYPVQKVSFAKSTRNYFTYYSTSKYEPIGFTNEPEIYLGYYDTYDGPAESKMSVTTDYPLSSLFRCGSLDTKPDDFKSTFKVVFYYRK